MANPKRPGQYHHGDLSSALVDEAVALTTERGLEGWTLSEAARRLGVTTGAPYKHFKNKTELLDAVAQRGLAEVRASIERALADQAAPREQMISTVQSLVRIALRKPTLYQLTFAGVRHDTLARLAKADPTSAFGVLRAAVEGWVAAGLLRARDPNELAILIWAHGHGLAALVASRRIELSERRAVAMAKLHVEALLDGIGA